MGKEWTSNQLDAIQKRNSNILVAAAAGSGKTAVLVERIIRKIIDDGIDIDKLLVVTFTNAAAAEMRERVLDAIYKKIEENPDNRNLQKQIVLLNKSNICTIHSFCLDVIKNNFFELDIPSNFRIGAEEEITILKDEVIEEMFEELYENNDKDFIKIVDTYTGYKGDEPLKELILKIYDTIQSNPFPNEWLHEQVEKFNLDGKLDDDFSTTEWGKILLDELIGELTDSINGFKILKNKLSKYDELDKYVKVINSDIDKLSNIILCAEKKWNIAYETVQGFKFDDWPQDRKCSISLKDEVHEARDDIKKKSKGIIDKILLYDSKSANQDIFAMYDSLVIIEKLIVKFTELYKEKKKEKNIIDFNDIEHFALNILVKKDEKGEFVATDIAKKYREKFEEIAIDEYQDSNLVQEKILTTVSKGNNVYMVGDVKQSIYKFRQANPDLFLEKYDKYSLNTANDFGLKIKLFMNFRSRGNVLNLTNLIFDRIMSKELGDIDYNKEEYLNQGNPYNPPENKEMQVFDKAELCIINAKEKEQELDIYKDVDDVENNDEEQEESEFERKTRIENAELEANFVAKKIDEILKSKRVVFDKEKGYREVTYKDIVILLRTTIGIAPIYEKVLSNKGFPIFSDASSEYLDSIEIETIMSVLKIIDNPIQDIPLVSVMRSMIGNFTDNEIIKIRLVDRECSFYDTLLKAKETVEDELAKKITDFLDVISGWRKDNEILGLDELIWKIYNDTGYYYYVSLMPNGDIRQANLKMLFERAKSYERTSFKGLFNFIRFIDNLKKGSGDLSSAKIINENENVIRIMSIHKSKGLEFPVVFLCNTNKQFNFQDLNGKILLHEKIGLGPKYINYDRRIEYNTAAKSAIRIKAKEEIISEEMRVLYVALTRAREKLIITGISKDIENDLASKKDLLEVYEHKDGKINSLLIKRFKSYLDWIEIVLLNDEKKMKELIDVSYYDKENIIFEKNDIDDNIKELDYEDYKDDLKEISEILNWNYKYLLSSKLPSKSTVSKIKQIESEDAFVDIDEFNQTEKKQITKVPNFMKEKLEITSAEKRNTNASNIAKD